MRSPAATLTEQELEIMKVIWQRGSATVREVYETLRERRKIAYTTVMTMMNILEQKGHLKKKAGDKAYLYTPAKPRKQIIRNMVRDFVERVFNGSAEPLVVHLLEDTQLSDGEIKEIEKLLRQRKRS